jgi:hypothetical protein
MTALKRPKRAVHFSLHSGQRVSVSRALRRVEGMPSGECREQFDYEVVADIKRKLIGEADRSNVVGQQFVNKE